MSKAINIFSKDLMHKVKLTMENYTIKKEFYVIYIGRIDVVLDIPWIISFGTYSTNH